MERFLAFRWDPGLAAGAAQVERWLDGLRAARESWTEVLACAGLRVLLMRPPGGDVRTVAISDGSGIVIGPIFARGEGGTGRLSELDRHQLVGLLPGTEGRDAQRCWGSFVVIARDGISGDTHLVRDPCGSLPCFLTRSHGVDIACSYVGDLAALPGLAFSIDWTAVQAFLVHEYFITHHTGLRDVREVLPGQRVTLHAGGRSTAAWTWNPSRIASEPRRQTFDDARTQLRAIADDCFQAWGRTHDRVAVRMSGGLDSTIVANLLTRNTAAAVTGIHLIGRGYEAYELTLARLAARHAGIALVELELTESTADLGPVLAGPLLPRPTGQILGAAADKMMADACHALGCDSVMTGHGGDSLFLQRSIAGDAFIDFVRLNGLSRGLGRVAYETATLAQRPLRRVVGEACAYLIGRRTWEPLAFLDAPDAVHKRFLPDDIIDRLPPAYLNTDWLDETRHLPPCKGVQVRGVIALRNYHSLMSIGLSFDAVQPLISQPIVEFCLRTPAYLFGHEGIDRSLERSAFADLAPDRILRRHLKGFINHHLTEDLTANAATLLEFLIEGNLVSNGLVGRTSIEALFGAEEAIPARSLEPILSLLAAEAWVATWKAQPVVRPN